MFRVEGGAQDVSAFHGAFRVREGVRQDDGIGAVRLGEDENGIVPVAGVPPGMGLEGEGLKLPLAVFPFQDMRRACRMGEEEEVVDLLPAQGFHLSEFSVKPGQFLAGVRREDAQGIP